MKTKNRNPISFTLSALVALLVLLFITEGCAKKDETPLPSPTITKTNTIVDNLPNRINTPSSTHRSPLSTGTSTETPLVVTGTPTPTSSNQLLGMNMIAIKEWDAYNIYLLDLDNGYLRRLGLPSEYHPAGVLSWSNDGCEIVVLSRGHITGTNAILEVDLQGNIVQSLLSLDPTEKIRNISLSPSQEWIAYRFSEGEALGGYEIIYESENIEVISAGGEVGPYRLTHGNGGREAAWAPDSTRLAYGDFDENGIPQLYVSNLDGSGRVQLTQFEDPLVEIRHIQWSPDGELIAFAYNRLGNISSMEPRKTDVMVISSDTSELPTIVDQVYLAYSLWWQGNDTLVVWGYKDEHGSWSANNENLFWVDAGTGEVTNILNGNITPEGYMINPQPLSIAHTIGYVTDHSFYSYDYLSQLFNRWDNVSIGVNGRINVDDWISVPASFQGEAACQP